MTATDADELRPRRAAPLVAPSTRLLGLDGLRALAVIAVLVYHLDDDFLPGGFLGVDVFFVLSGYLITTLLVQEWRDAGWVALVPFWRRRARRLLPSLLVLLLGVALATPVFYADVAARIRGELLAALAQGSNWFEALAGRSYFDDLGRPSPLRHLWSLGVEAQFYVLWPVVAVVALHRGGTRALQRVAAAGAALSFLAMAVLHAPGEDPSRLYYGTDTRFGTLLVGALLAVAWPGARLRRSIAERARTIVDVAGAVALLGLVVLAARLDGASTATYRGGLLLAAVLAAVVVAAAVHPASRVAGALSARPLVWLGTRSYAVYLWHWPVITATRPHLDVDVHGWALLVLRLTLTLGVAEVSTRLVAGLLHSASWQADVATRRRVVLGVASLVLAAAAITARAPETTQVLYVSPTTTLAERATVASPSSPIVAFPPTTGALPPPTTAPVTATAPLPPSPPATVGVFAPPPPTTAIRSVAVGESVLMAAGGEVQRAVGDGTIVDAAVARQPHDVLDALESRRATGYLFGADSVIVQIGSNGPLDGPTLDRLATLVAGVRRVVAVTVHVDRPWAEGANAALRDAAARHPWLRLADWHAAAGEHPEWLAHDGVHPNRSGARAYAALVAAAVNAP